MQPFLNYLKHPSYLYDSLVRHYGQWLPDSVYIQLRYLFHMGKSLNLDNPHTYQEKLQWLKLHDRNPMYTIMVDKVLVKEYVSSIIGCQYVIPLLGVWEKPEDIDWNKLPNRFVLKTNHGGGNTGVIICKNRASFDCQQAVAHLNKSLKMDVYKDLREWPYKNIHKCVLAEEYIESSDGDLPDYKFFCFNGKVRALFVATDRQNPNEDVKFDFFDADYNHLPLIQGHANAKVPPKKPQSFNEMKQIAEKLSKGIPHVRVDLYESSGRPVFGELTFCHFGGMVPFEPEEWDYKLGQWLKLPEN